MPQTITGGQISSGTFACGTDHWESALTAYLDLSSSEEQGRGRLTSSKLWILWTAFCTGTWVARACGRVARPQRVDHGGRIEAAQPWRRRLAWPGVVAGTQPRPAIQHCSARPELRAW